MNATVLREKRQITLPGAVLQAAGVQVNDVLEWRFEAGEIRGVKLSPTRQGKAKLVKKAGYTMLRSERVVTLEEMLSAIQRDGL